jgi:hypothetical protein
MIPIIIAIVVAIIIAYILLISPIRDIIRCFLRPKGFPAFIFTPAVIVVLIV